MPSPTRIGALAYPATQPAFQGRMGPYIHGSDWFVISNEIVSFTGPLRIVAYKSTNQGVAWTRVAASAANHSGNVCPFYKGSGDTIHIAYLDDASPTATLRGVLFDMGTETFGGAFSTGHTLNINNLTSLGFAVLGSGDWVYLYAELLVEVVNAIASSDSGATWSAPVAISGATPHAALDSGAVVNGAGNLAINWSRFTDATNVHRVTEYCSIFDGTTILHTNTVLLDASKVRLQDLIQKAGWYDPTSDSLIFPTFQILTGTHLQVNLLVGTPSANPVFSTVIVYDNPSAANDFYWAPSLAVNAAGSRFEVLWADDIGNFPFQSVIYRCTGSTPTGIFSAPTVYYDEQADPPTPAPAFDELFPVQAIFAGSTLSVVMGMLQTVAPGEDWCGVLFVLSVAGGLTLPCPLASPGTVGVPFTETLIASSGTPPYTYAVAIGYSLPPGLTLDSTTGIISGTPTAAGTFNIAYMVTDSLGHTATTIGTCPIPISGPGTGGACDNPGTNPSLDSYLELRKVLVAWKKETHLSVRGKS